MLYHVVTIIMGRKIVFDLVYVLTYEENVSLTPVKLINYFALLLTSLYSLVPFGSAKITNSPGEYEKLQHGHGY